jgi:hypothetical protein
MSDPIIKALVFGLHPTLYAQLFEKQQEFRMRSGRIAAKNRTSSLLPKLRMAMAQKM